ncbi:hypothetical protein ACEPAF_2748 [Sanghuangporus sanghuang]
MNNPSRSSNVSSRAKRPVRALPALPSGQEPSRDLPHVSHLVKDDIHEPFQLLDTSPLNLICQYHNVKHVSLEEGVPPPFKVDVPVLHGAIENSNALLPTHVLAVYDQDTSSARTGPMLSPLYAGPSSGRSSLPATALLIPVNVDLWASHFTTALSADPSPSSSSIPAIDAMRRRSRTDSVGSESSQMTSRASFSRSRPSSVLSLPVHVVRVPSAKALPLLLLSSLGILPHNHVLPALLPRKVLTELPAPPGILVQALLKWLYPNFEGQERRGLDAIVGYSPFFRTSPIPRSLSIPRSPRLPPSPLLSPSFSPDSDARKRLSTASASSLLSTGSISSFPSSGSPACPRRSSASSSEPVCVLADPTIRDDPDLRLLLLAQQNFGLWANALALGACDPAVVRLVELAWSIASEARRMRFGIGDRSPTPEITSDAGLGGRSPHSSLRSRQGHSHTRPSIPFLDAPPKSSSR